VIDLNANHLAIVVSILKTHLPGERVLVFGSRAAGCAKPFSDLDLAIDMSAPLPVLRLANLRDAFEASALPFKVDLVELISAAPAFAARIREQGVKI
jgi:type I restriction enzyme S subunit